MADDYGNNENRLAPFYPGHFRDSGAFLAKAAEVDGRFDRRTRERAASMVHAPSETAREGLGRFVEEGGYFVTTGQQPGLFTGPLYSIYKALTALRLSQTLEPLLGRPVLPLFWVASEDHDWAESDHAHVMDPGNELRTVRVAPPEGSSHRALHRIPLGPDVEDTVSQFLQHLPESDFSAPLFNLIRESYSSGATLPQGFQATMAGLLEDLPILFVDAANPDLKAASQSVLFRELEESARHEEILTDDASKLEAEGYHVQVHLLDGGVNLFLDGPEGRDRLYRDGDGFHLHRAGTRMGLEEIKARTEEDPGILSPNVLLRPVVESILFPTVSYVGGPGEVAYFAQLGGLFRAHGLSMPVIHPRHSVTLIEGKIQKVLEKFQQPVDSLRRPHHELAAEIAREDVPPEVRKALGEIRGAVGKGSAALGKAVQSIDSTLKGPVTHARNSAFLAFEEVERKVLQALKRENEIALDQLEKAQRHLFPLGKPQERVLNGFYYLARYGPGLISELAREFDVALGTDSA